MSQPDVHVFLEAYKQRIKVLEVDPCFAVKVWGQKKFFQSAQFEPDSPALGLVEE